MIGLCVESLCICVVGDNGEVLAEKSWMVKVV